MLVLLFALYIDFLLFFYTVYREISVGALCLDDKIKMT